MGLILVPLFLLDVLLVLYACVHIFMMKTLSPTSWQYAMLLGLGVALLISFRTVFFKSTASGEQAVSETMQNLLNLMVTYIAYPAILVFILSWLPTSWYGVHFAEGVLGAISAGTFTCSILFFLFSTWSDNLKKKK